MEVDAGVGLGAQDTVQVVVAGMVVGAQVVGALVASLAAAAVREALP